MRDSPNAKQVAAEIEAEIAEVCGLLNATAGRLVGLIAKVLETGAWEGAGIRSSQQWVAWKCGVSPARARRLVAMARRLSELPETKVAMEAGELCEDQVAVIVVEERDRGCRVPGCDRSRWLHVHHVQHWEDGGSSDTANLVALCQHHHRLHHRGGLGISGNADDPDGMTFTDERGRTLDSTGRPVPPRRAPEETARELGIPSGNWSRPTGRAIDPFWVDFDERAG